MIMAVTKSKRQEINKLLRKMNGARVSQKLLKHLLDNVGKNGIESITSELNFNRKQVISSVSRLREIGVGIRSGSSECDDLWYQLTMNPEDCIKKSTRERDGMDELRFVSKAAVPTPSSMWPWLTGTSSSVFS